MFDLLGGETSRIANRLFERAQEAEIRYGKLDISNLKRLILIEFSEKMRYFSHDQVNIYYDGLEDFSFSFIFMLESSTLTIQAGGIYRGFMLQRAANRWHVAVDEPLGGPLGHKAERLAAIFEKRFGIRNLKREAERAMASTARLYRR